MKKFIFIIVICVLVLGIGMSACKSKESAVTTAVNSKTSLDWEGIYTGIVPCADCPGIFTQITLTKYNTYSLKMEYMGDKESAKTLNGMFKWDETGKMITMDGLKESSIPFAYLVSKNKLVQLDLNGKVISGKLASNYVLTKVDEKLVDKKWKLKEINGVALSTMESKPAKEAFITFQVNGNQVSGSSGCNNFSGTYKIDDGKSLNFSGVASTRMMCIGNMTVENQMNKIFQDVDNYTLINDTLSLNKAKTALARFDLSD